MFSVNASGFQHSDAIPDNLFIVSTFYTSMCMCPCPQIQKFEEQIQASNEWYRQLWRTHIYIYIFILIIIHMYIYIYMRTYIFTTYWQWTCPFCFQHISLHLRLLSLQPFICWEATVEAETPASDVAWMSIIESWKTGYDMKAKRYVNIVSGNGRCILIYIIYTVCVCL